MADKEKQIPPQENGQSDVLPAEKKELSLEEAFDRLEKLAGLLEEPQTTLEDSFLHYKEGMELLKYCSQKLDLVEKKMLQLNEDGSFGEFQR